MEMERVIEFPHNFIDVRPRKRQRLGWDVAPQTPKSWRMIGFNEAQLELLLGQDIGNLTSYATPKATSDHTVSDFVKTVARICSPPLRADDKDGHYMFELGENLTSRCNYLFLPSQRFTLC
ncbi:hypothetical protein Leryth_006538 [Lithospermum erythrorhizon]|nr:hypothetical protein Leryth_006538 [Lithospermum erythrorhizon]